MSRASSFALFSPAFPKLFESWTILPYSTYEHCIVLQNLQGLGEILQHITGRRSIDRIWGFEHYSNYGFIQKGERWKYRTRTLFLSVIRETVLLGKNILCFNTNAKSDFFNTHLLLIMLPTSTLLNSEFLVQVCYTFCSFSRTL